VLGLSVAYMVSTFLGEVEKEFGKHTDPNYYEVNKRMLFSDSAKGRKLICPRDQREGCSYVDAVHLLEKGHTAPATIMLSWSWHYTVKTVVFALARWCRVNGKNPAEVFVWQCALCNNQFRVEENKAKGQWESFETFKALFEKRMDHTNHIVSLMAPWDEPVNIKRIWCVFEKHMAVVKGHKFDVILPQEEDARFQKALEEGGMQPVWELFSKVDIQSASATSETDKRNILQLVDPDLDLDAKGAYSKKCSKLNAEVVSRLQQWFVRLAEQSLLERSQRREPIHLQAWANVAFLLETVRGSEENWDKATSMYHRAMDVAKAQGETETKQYAFLLVKYASHLSRSGTQNHRQQADFLNEEAETLFESLGETDSQEYAELVKNQAIGFGIAGDYAKQREYLQRARAVLERSGEHMSSRTYANVLRLIAKGKSMTAGTSPEEVMDLFRTAEQVWDGINSRYSMGCGALLREMGLYIARTDKARATEYLREAQKVLVASGSTQTQDYANLLKAMGAHFCDIRQYDEAQRNLEKAVKHYEKIRLLESVPGITALTDLGRVYFAQNLDELAVATLRRCEKIIKELIEQRRGSQVSDIGALRTKQGYVASMLQRSWRDRGPNGGASGGGVEQPQVLPSGSGRGYGGSRSGKGRGRGRSGSKLW